MINGSVETKELIPIIASTVTFGEIIQQAKIEENVKSGEEAEDY